MKWRDVPSSNSIKLLIQQQLDLILPSVYGYSLIKLGELSAVFNCDNANVVNQLIISQHRKTDVCADLVHLPLASDDVDAIFAPLVLEESINPHQLLREIVRSLRPGGKLIIVTFNPLSSWALHKLLLHRTQIKPWCYPFYRKGKLNDWLSLLGLEVTLEHRLFARLPGSEYQHNTQHSSQHIESVDYSRFGAINMSVAEKKIKTLTPIKMPWKQSQIIKPSMVGTTHRT